MKRMLVLLLALLLCGCGAQEPGVTYPEPEPALPLGILALDPEPGEEAPTARFSITCRREPDAMKLILFRLQNGTFEDIAGGSWQPLPEGSRNGGILALDFAALFQQCRFTWSAAGAAESGVLEPQLGPEEGLAALNRETVLLKARTEAEFGQLIPLALQVCSHQDRIYPPDLQIWDHPEAYEIPGDQEIFLLAFSLREKPETP